MNSNRLLLSHSNDFRFVRCSREGRERKRGGSHKWRERLRQIEEVAQRLREWQNPVRYHGFIVPACHSSRHICSSVNL